MYLAFRFPSYLYTQLSLINLTLLQKIFSTSTTYYVNYIIVCLCFQEVISGTLFVYNFFSTIFNAIYTMVSTVINTMAVDWSKGFASDTWNWEADIISGIKSMINNLADTVTGVAQAMQLTSAVVGGSSGGTVNNYYNNDNSRTVNQTNHSPKALSRLEIYRQTRNALSV